jgi:hypothetical protein
MAKLHRGNHKAAIALNNAAVSLLARGYCYEALDTFKDAVKLMRCATRPFEQAHDGILDGGDASDNFVSEHDVQLALERANKRCAECSHASRLPPPTSTADGTAAATDASTASSKDSWPILQVITTQHNPSRVYDVLTSSTAALQATQVAFPMTIEHVGSSSSHCNGQYDNDGCTVDDVAFEAGVVLYNYGLAYECLAASACTFNSHPTMDNHVLQEMARSKSHRMFHLAIAVLSKLDRHNGDHNCSHNTSTLSNQLLLLRTVMMHSLIHTSIMRQLETEYYHYCHAMQTLLQAVEVQQWLLPGVAGDHAVAAAA